MNNNNFLKIHNILWLFYLVLFYFSPFDYKVKESTLVILFIILSISNLSFFLGYSNNSYNKILGSNSINIKGLFQFLVLNSFIYFLLTILKYGSLKSTFDFDISLSGFTELRMAMDTEDYEKGNNIFGILASLFSGFPILLIPFYILYKNRLSKQRQVILFILIGAYLASTFSSGGRNGAMIVILFIYFSFKSVKIIKINLNILSNKLKFFFLAVLFLIVISFSKIFIERAELTSGSINDYIVYAQLTHPFNLKEYANNILNDDKVNALYFPAFLFHDYFVHSLKELEITINNEPINFPYWGSYQFYTFSILLNKIGFNILTIEEILKEIPNPGRYLTLYGGVYLDFGFYGMFVFVSIIYFFAGFYLKKFIQTHSFLSLIWFLYFFIIIFLSPLFSVIGISMYPGILVALIAMSVIMKLGFFKIE